MEPPGKLKIMGGNGITLRLRGKTISMDPKRRPDADVTFVSHAHVDHLHEAGRNSVVIASRETVRLSSARGYSLGEAKEEMNGFELFDAGHILGSRGILVDGEVFYTGDFAGRPRAFLGRGKTVKCSTLIMEATYGRNRYVFPPVAEVLAAANRVISDLYSRGTPVILMGHPLGKAQVIHYLFSSWEPFYVHPQVEELNQIHREAGVDLQDNTVSLDEAEDRGLLEKGPWVLLSPIRGGRSPLVQKLKKRYGAVTIAFSGWACDPRYKDSLGVDYALPLSDHCDFNDLVELAKKCEPEKIYTVYGFASEFASYLRRLGFNASPLVGGQSSLSDYVSED